MQPDTLIPDPYNTLDWDRYQYVRSNPLRYTDSSGHCIDGISTWACIAVITGIALKIADYGWSAYDTYQSGKVLSNPSSSHEDKLLAALNVGMAIIFEAVEPDDLLPVGSPLDDVGRKTVLAGAKNALDEGGPEALEKFIRDNLGDYADDTLKQIDKLLGIDNVRFPTNPGQIDHIFRNAPGHLPTDTLANRNLFFDTISRNNYVRTDQFGVQWFSRLLDDGREVWVAIRDGVIQNGGINTVPKWIAK